MEPDNSLSDGSIVIKRHGHQIELSGRFKESIFERNVKKYYFDEKISHSIEDALDDRNDYSPNNYGYRGPDFRPGVDIVAAGCSATYGVGVPEDGTWPALLAEKTGMSYINLSAPGASIEWVVQSLFSYFNEFGNPKVVALLIPDLFRMEVVLNSDINQSREVSIRDWSAQGIDLDFKKGVVTCRSVELDMAWRARLSKRPFAIEDTIPPEEPIYRSFKHLMMLETYCKAAGIQLLWTGWSDDVSSLLEDYGPNYFSDCAFTCDGLEHWKAHWYDLPMTDEDPEGIKDIKMSHVDNPECPTNGVSSECTCFIYCHAELEARFPEAFYLGTDRYIKGKDNSHMGVHKLAHIAEDFASRIAK
jgi:hypothetical protein